MMTTTLFWYLKIHFENWVNPNNFEERMRVKIPWREKWSKNNRSSKQEIKKFSWSLAIFFWTHRSKISLVLLDWFHDRSEQSIKSVSCDQIGAKPIKNRLPNHSIIGYTCIANNFKILACWLVICNIVAYIFYSGNECLILFDVDSHWWI